MAFRYTAKIFIDEREVDHESGDDVDELNTWMLVKSQGKFGNFSGHIVDNKTKKIVRRFRKAPPD
jgi:hypothetical protein